MKKKQKILLYSLVALFCIFFNGVKAYGVEGQVSTGGKISFYEESIEPSTSDSSKSTQQSSSSISTKPTGKLPRTGEIIRNSSFVLGAILLFLACILFLRRRKKEEKS